MTSQMEILADLFDSVETNMDTVCNFAFNIQAPQDLLSNLDYVKISITKCKKSIVLHLNHGLPVNISNFEANQHCKTELIENKVKSEEKIEQNEISDMLESSEILFEIDNGNKRDNNLSKLIKTNENFMKNEKNSLGNTGVSNKSEKYVDIETKIESEQFDETDYQIDMDDNMQISEDDEGNLSGLTELCGVCERPAPSYKNYGAICCFSCRAFFRRSANRDYRCVLRTGECQAKGGKLSCQLCRYNKCLKVGMDPDLVDKQKSKKQNKLGGNAALTETCRVCGNPASKYLNFGVICCGSCRVFFMRHCHRQLSCVDGTDNCKQDQSGKIKCQSCRIKKCIEVGMSPDSVGHKQKQKNIVSDSIKPKTNVNENSEILNKPQALINHLNFTKKNHKFKYEEVLSALEICDYKYFIIGKETDDEIKEQCGICSYHGPGELTEHIQAHFQLVSCKDCHLQLFEFERNYHQKMTHFLKCRFCSRRLKTIENHEEKCRFRPVSGLSCKICGKTMSSQRNMVRHMLRTHKPEGTDHPCHICGRIFKHQEAVKNHHRNVHEFTHPCDICEAKFQTRTHLLKHKLEAHSVDLRECCDKCGAYVFNLWKHRYMKHQNGKSDCKLCGKSYASKRILRTHVRRFHEKSLACKCEICGKQFSTKSVLPRHMRNVHKIEVSSKEKIEKIKGQNENC